MAIKKKEIKESISARCRHIIVKTINSKRKILQIEYYPFNINNELMLFENILRKESKNFRIKYEKIKDKKYKLDDTIIELSIYKKRV